MVIVGLEAVHQGVAAPSLGSTANEIEESFLNILAFGDNLHVVTPGDQCQQCRKSDPVYFRFISTDNFSTKLVESIRYLIINGLHFSPKLGEFFAFFGIEQIPLLHPPKVTRAESLGFREGRLQVKTDLLNDTGAPFFLGLARYKIAAQLPVEQQLLRIYLDCSLDLGIAVPCFDFAKPLYVFLVYFHIVDFHDFRCIIFHNANILIIQWFYKSPLAPRLDLIPNEPKETRKLEEDLYIYRNYF